MTGLVDKWCNLEETAEYLGVTKDQLENELKKQIYLHIKLEDYGNLNSRSR